MLVGDTEAARLVRDPAAIVGPHERATAERFPVDLSVTIEGTSAGCLLLIAAPILTVAGVFIVVDSGDMYNSDWLIFLNALPCAVPAWLANRYLVRRRREFRLVDDGIIVEVKPLIGGAPDIAGIPWTAIENYTVSVDHEKALLRVQSIHDFTITLHDRPARLVTRELIRRFVEQAERHPRAVPPSPRPNWARFPDVTGEYSLTLGTCLTYLSIPLSGVAMGFLEPSPAQTMAGLAAAGLIFIGVKFGIDLDDLESARDDARSARPAARLRTWLRRVLRIRPT
ncbi:MAG TPA: hypothetical protein VE871_01055 [Longimicrobium sp.]|nr:hypothetical protein [Longimicrobium sp.]